MPTAWAWGWAWGDPTLDRKKEVFVDGELEIRGLGAAGAPARRRVELLFPGDEKIVWNGAS
jgi:hypothetical protein